MAPYSHFKRILKDRLRGSIRREARVLASIRQEVEESKILSAQVLICENQRKGIVAHLKDVEFKVFSQFGEDGIIQYLLDHVPISHDTFVEFGVEDYQESNTRFLLQNNNWRGLVLDASEANIRSIYASPLAWRYDLTAQCTFITRDNINDLLISAGVQGPIGLLSIDIDGNDYWVWEAIDAVDPVLVVVEYNSLWGPHRAVTIPYDAGFNRHAAHFSGQYFGASLAALCHLAERKGYVLVGSNSHGSNAFFVRSDCAGALEQFDAESAYVAARFRQSRDVTGKLTFRPMSDTLPSMLDLPLYDVERNHRITIREFVESPHAS